MINDWRVKWSSTGSNPDFPFGFVQLGNFIGAPWGVLIRWHQTDDDGIVDGSIFMALAIDTYDEEQEIHPRNKQIIGERLGISGGFAAYGLTENPQNGPFPAMTINPGLLILDYPAGPGITYDNTEISGFYVCCVEYDTCDNDYARWALIPDEKVVVDISQSRITIDHSAECESGPGSGIAYLWDDAPVKGMLAAPIYSNDRFRLPAAPWKVPA